MPRGTLSRFADTTQTSHGKFDHFHRTLAEFTPKGLDSYGLRHHLLARPTQERLIQFLFVKSRFCSALPSDPASRLRPCALLQFTAIRFCEDLHLQLSNMRGTQDKSAAYLRPRFVFGYKSSS